MAQKKFEWQLSNKWGYAAAISLIPYAILKTLWTFGVTIMVFRERNRGSSRINENQCRSDQ